MQPLVEYLQKLWKSVSTRDVLQPQAEPFKLHAVVLYCTNDYPGLGIMTGRVTSGYTQGWFLWPLSFPSQKSPLPKKQEKVVVCWLN
jgi:hypothetical protein